MSRARDPQAGLTLIEVLVVLAIIGVMAGVTVLGLGALDRGARAESEALRLADRLQLASDTALTSSAPLALVWDVHGYRFDSWDPKSAAWRPSEERLLGPRHALPAAFRLLGEASDATPPVLIAPAIPQAPVALRIAGGDAAWEVRFDGVGAVAAPAP